MKALITGGAGFIGSHLADRLLKDGHEVVVIDDLSTGSINNIKHIRNQKRFTFLHETVFNSPLVEKLVEQCDVIFHLAASVGVKYVVEHLVTSMMTNIRGTEIILELASRYDKKVFIASSSEVYGKSEKPKFKEDDDIVFGHTSVFRWSYAHSKAVDEYLGLAYYRERDLKVYIGRFFNTVGPRQVGTYGMVIPRFVESALSGKPIVVYGDGKQVRSFCHVDNVIEVVLRLMENEKAAGEVYNIGNDQPIEIGELAKFVKQLTGSSSEIRYQSFSDVYGDFFEDIKMRVPDLTRIRSCIEYPPLQDIGQILESIIRSKKEAH